MDFVTFASVTSRTHNRRIRVRQSAGGVINFPQEWGQSRMSLKKSSLRTTLGPGIEQTQWLRSPDPICFPTHSPGNNVKSASPSTINEQVPCCSWGHFHPGGNLLPTSNLFLPHSTSYPLLTPWSPLLLVNPCGYFFFLVNRIFIKFLQKCPWELFFSLISLFNPQTYISSD